MSSWLGRVAGRTLQSTQHILMGHILNPLWSDRDTRRKRRYAAALNSTMRYLRRYAPEVSKIVPEPVNTPDEPERAFTIWFQGEENAPALVKACFRSMRKHLKQQLIVLDENTLFDWITLPEHVVRKWREGKILHTQFSDICRVELLYEHGGLWFDATDFITAPVPQYIMDEDIFFFQAGTKVRGSYAGMQSCFIRGRKGNPLLGVWREADFIYWREENSKIDYFVHHLLMKLSVKSNSIARESYDKMAKVDQDPTHTLWTPHLLDEYDEETFSQLTSETFFQKTNYKSGHLKKAQPGSIADFIINKSNL